VIRKSIAFTLLCSLLCGALGFKACSNPDGAQRNIHAAGYDAQLALEAGARTAKAFNARGRLSRDKYRYTLRKLSEASEAIHRLNLEIEKYPTIDPANKQAVLAAVDEFLSRFDTIIADNLLIQLDAETQSQVRRWLFVARSIGLGIKVAVAGVSTPTPSAKVLITEATAKDIQSRATARDFSDQDAQLVADIVNISTDFLIRIKEQKGLSTDQIRSLRDDQYARLRKFLASELAV
jgi:hypothetical protein